MGDDVAALRWGSVTALLTTDALSEGTHFLARSPAEWVGRAAVAASFSDLASKGGVPVAVLLDLLLPPTTPERWARSVVLGAERFAANSGCHVVGGDTKASEGRCVVGTVVGLATTPRLPRRDAARPGDVLIVTGTVGRGGAAARAYFTRRRPTRSDLVDLLRIDPRLREGRAIAPHARAMIDTSDGLADAAHRLARASGVRIVVEEGEIPWDAGLAGTASMEERLLWGLYGGDYELLAAIPGARTARRLRSLPGGAARVSVIGTVQRGTGAFLRIGGRLRPMPPAGWDPFGGAGPRPAVRR
ncbi:MAG TPA: thiamine-phosphate kinase [Thermoplasmata archaeon]|nr:thiamine-phosphate kinase [Thermoplasmata archaeon]